MRTKQRHWLESTLLAAGVIFLAIYVGARADGYLQSRNRLRAFQTQKEAGISGHLLTSKPVKDFRLWSPKRVTLYMENLGRIVDPPEAILRIPKIGLEVAVLEGTDEIALNRGVGRVLGTAKPGESGNIGIAGHRDGFFRALKDIGPGDGLELETVDSKESYVVDEIVIVEPDKTEVLRTRKKPALTLITCYPFYFVGDAPKRYIVHASLKQTIPTITAAVQPSNTKGMKFNDQEKKR
jgi:sortase A